MSESRLDQGYIVAVVRNGSGVDAGEIDYTLNCARFDRQDKGSLEDIMETLSVLISKCNGRIKELKRTQND